MSNPLLSLQNLGQSVYLDDLHRSLITSGELKRLIEEDGLRGLSSNPSILEKAIDDGEEYRDMLEAPEYQAIDSNTLYERIAVRDVQDAADVLGSVYLESMRRDGYVSLEVSPRLARDLQGTLEEARRMWQTVARENLMIKIPATPQSIPAIQELISEGINVSANLIFTAQVYEQVAVAYLCGLESWALKGGDPAKVASFASISIRAIDAAIDAWITEQPTGSHLPESRDRFGGLSGQVAIANAKTIYMKYLEILRGDRWQRLCLHGAQPQRLVWADTTMINPHHSELFYVEALIGSDTLIAMAPIVLESFRDHGHPRASLTEGWEEARRTMDLVETVGIPFQTIAARLLAEGVDEFADAFAKLLQTTRRNHPSGYDPVTFLRLKLFKEFYNMRPLS